MKHNNWLILTIAFSLATVLLQSTARAGDVYGRNSQEDGPVLTQSNPPSSNGSSLQTDDADPQSAQKEEPTARKDDDSSAEEKETATPPAAPAKAKHQLTQGQAALRDQVRQTLANFQKQPFDTRQNSAGDIMDFCLPYGCATEITLYNASGERRANGITCLCWNFPCDGFEPLTMNDGHIAARLGYGVQSQPSQLLATLAFARVQANYPLRAENTVRTVADLIESEKRSCREGADLSLKAIGLAYYAEETTWQNDLGEDWSLEKIVREELNRPVLTAGEGGLNRLLGLAFVNHRRFKRNLPLDGQYARAEKYLSDFHKFAFNVQNADGSWGYFLSARGSTKDPVVDLRSTAYVLGWLALSLPEDQLGDSRVTAAVNYVVQGLNTQRNRAASSLPSREINSIARALHGLSIYDDRFYQTAAEDKPAAEKPATEKSSQKTAAKPSSESRSMRPKS
jgi:hypothetical protein